jgi:uncharacterized membrane protein (Fun14 family)
MTFKGFVGILLAVVFIGSTTARLVMDRDDEDSPEMSSPSRQVPEGGTGFLPGLPSGRQTPQEQPPEEEEDGLQKALPVVSEASFFGFLGFALGYASRKVLKIGLIVVGFFFIFVQGMAYLGIIQVDWQRALDLVNDAVLNIKGNQTVGEFVKNRIPAAGALVAGYFLGFRKG